MFPLAFGLEETVYEILSKNFQWWSWRQSLLVKC